MLNLQQNYPLGSTSQAQKWFKEMYLSIYVVVGWTLD